MADIKLDVAINRVATKTKTLVDALKTKANSQDTTITNNTNEITQAQTDITALEGKTQAFDAYDTNTQTTNINGSLTINGEDTSTTAEMEQYVQTQITPIQDQIDKRVVNQELSTLTPNTRYVVNVDSAGIVSYSVYDPTLLFEYAADNIIIKSQYYDSTETTSEAINGFYKNDRIIGKYIGAYAFFNAQLTTLNLVDAIYIGPQAFLNSPLTTLELPQAVIIGSGAFEKSLLTTLEAPKATTIKSVAFSDSPLTSINIPQATIVEYQAFKETVNASTTTITMLQTTYDNLSNAAGGRNTPNLQDVFGDYDQITFTLI